MRIRQGKAFADPAADAGGEHFRCSSVGGAERDAGIPHFESKWEVEEHISDMGLPATILRPVSVGAFAALVFQDPEEWIGRALE
jgi:uncharacterized protein YbjT (DUF2867 family)